MRALVPLTPLLLCTAATSAHASFLSSVPTRTCQFASAPRWRRPREARCELSEEGTYERARLAELAKFEIDEDVLREHASAFALLFNPGSSNEGIYSRRLPSAAGSTMDLVVCFEDEDDAKRYSDMLHADDFPEAAPCAVEMGALMAFCEEGGHTLGMVRHGQLVVPPSATVEQFEWSPGVSEEGLQLGEPRDEASQAALEAQRRDLEAMLRRDAPDC